MHNIHLTHIYLIHSKKPDSNKITAGLINYGNRALQAPGPPPLDCVLRLPGPSLEIIGPEVDVSVPDEVSPGALPVELPEPECDSAGAAVGACVVC